MIKQKKFFKIIICIYLLLKIQIINSIKISVIIPIYNTSLYLERCINSVLNQTLKEIEIFLIDDASTDDSFKIIKKYEDKDKRIKAIHINENKGPSIARNTGINLSIGEYISFIDSDDYIDEKYFENLYNYSKGFDVIIGTFVDSTNNSRYYIHHMKYKNIQGYVIDSLFRRKFLDDNNIRFPTNIRYMEDKIFRINCSKYNPKIFETPDTGIYYYYMHRKGSLCNYKNIYMKNLNKKIKKEIRNNKKKGKKYNY